MLRQAIRQTGNVVRRQLCTSSILNCSSTTEIHTTYIEIPRYPIDKPQTLEKRKARLIYQSRKRGMLENDLLLSTFVGKYLSVLNENQIMMYDRLINGPSNDWDIFYWITEKLPTPKEYDNEIMEMLKEHAKNTDKVALRCPDLDI